MADSIETLFEIAPITIAQAHRLFGCEYWVLYKDKPGTVSGGKVEKLKSSLTDAGFTVTPYLDTTKKYVIGFLTKVNTPACTIGNNAFVHVIPYEASKISLLLLKNHLKNVGAQIKEIRKIKLKNAVIKSLDITYLLSCSNFTDAVKTRDELENRINSIYSHLPTTYRNHLGEKNDRTVYLNMRNYPSIRGYVKWHDIKSSGKYSLYDGVHHLSDKIKEKIYAASAKFLRIEAGVSEAYLEKHYPGMSKVSAWKDLGKANEVLKGIFETFRAMIHLDVDYRRNEFRAYDYAKLDLKVQETLKMYFAGKLGDYLKKLTKNQRYELKKKVFEAARIDITIPWRLHKQLKPLPWCVQPGAPVLSSEDSCIEPYVFNQENLPVLIEKLLQSRKPHNSNETADISDLMGDPSEAKDLKTPTELYRGIGDLKIPTLPNMVEIY